MRIQHNIAALNTHRNLGFNNTNASKALEKLSSGYKINRAGDDAAGLAISEKMRGQIRGLNMAQKNAQDGISLIQTAEGALNEVHAMLQRGRELAVQAANDTNTDEDRAQLQKELAQIKDEIDGIRARTEFNTKSILKGGSKLGSAGANVDAFMKKLKDYMLESAEAVVKNDYGINMADVKNMDLEFTQEGPGGSAAYVTSTFYLSDGKSFEWTMTFDMDDIDRMNDDEIESVVIHEMTHAMMSASGMDWRDASIPKWFKEGTAEYITGSLNRIYADLGLNATTAATFNDTAKLEQLLKLTDTTNSAIIGSSDFYSASYLATKYLDQKIGETAPGKDITDVMAALQTGVTLDQAIQTATGSNYDLATFKSDLTSIAGLAVVQKYINDGDLLSISGNTEAALMGTTANPIDESTNFKYDFQGTSGDEGATEVILHIGANKDQRLIVDLPNLSAGSIGIGGVNISTQEGANKAIESFDIAISNVSNDRSYLGAIQNRLEHTINNLGATSENLQAAESRIRDTDMAKEMMNFTKQNILMQAAQSMLAQANQQPQGVLQLLG